jgi:acetyl-CoA carboxylase biotin carboxylase subunit
MKKAGVPTSPGSDGLLSSMEEGLTLAKEMGYPVIVKATAGGGGKGMRIINEPGEFKKAWDDAKREAAAAFGNDGLYLEKFIEEPRHIEIQLVGDQYGKACHLSERDCSIQRRHQKLVEETPSPILNQEFRDQRCKGYQLRRRGHHRVPRRQTRQLLFYGDEHPYPG